VLLQEEGEILQAIRYVVTWQQREFIHEQLIETKPHEKSKAERASDSNCHWRIPSTGSRPLWRQNFDSALPG
jgi:hypothetical protein